MFDHGRLSSHAMLNSGSRVARRLASAAFARRTLGRLHRGLSFSDNVTHIIGVQLLMIAGGYEDRKPLGSMAPNSGRELCSIRPAYLGLKVKHASMAN